MRQTIKALLLLSAGILMMCNVQAQRKVKTRFGVIGGFSVGQTKYEGFPFDADLATVEPLGSFYGGVLVEIPIVKHFAIQPEVLYSQYGFRREAQGERLVNDYTERINYVEIPLSFKFTVHGFAVSAGPKVSFLTGAKQEEKTFQLDAVTERKEFYRSSTWSALFGIEYTAPFGLGIHTRYTLGLTDAADHSLVNGYPDTQKIKLNAFQLGLHFSF